MMVEGVAQFCLERRICRWQSKPRRSGLIEGFPERSNQRCVRGPGYYVLFFPIMLSLLRNHVLHGVLKDARSCRSINVPFITDRLEGRDVEETSSRIPS